MNSGGIFDLPTKQRELEELEKEAMTPDFWANSQRVQTVNQRIAALKDEIGEYEKIESAIDDLQVLIELAIEERRFQFGARNSERYRNSYDAVRENGTAFNVKWGI